MKTVYLMLLISVPTFAAQWGVKELLAAQEASLEHLKSKAGDAAYDSVLGFSIDKNSQGTAAKAKITYMENGEKKTASYFCHEHEEDVIDCH